MTRARPSPCQRAISHTNQLNHRGFSLPFRQPEPSAVRVWQVAYHSLRVYAFSLAYAFLLRKHDPCLAG